MKYPNKFSYGQMFAFSGLDGESTQAKDFVGVMQNTPVRIRFHLVEWIELRVDVAGEPRFDAVLCDVVEASEQGVKVVFMDKNTVVGYAPTLPTVATEKGAKTENLSYAYEGKDVEETVVTTDAGDTVVLRTWASEHGYSFTFSLGVQEVLTYTEQEIDEVVRVRKAYYEDKPKCKDERYEKLYYKCLSVNKVNVHTAEGKIPCMWTTPDRVPHRHMWLWDSVFHALAIVNYNQELAQNCIRAVLSQARKDGFISHMMNPIDCSDVTQPQVLAWGVWEVYQKTKDQSFLKESVGTLEKYLEWDRKNRDKNGNGLLEWLTEPEDLNCKCGESGLDNSPRFDYDMEMDAIDFSCFQARDAEYLSKIYAELGEKGKAKKWLEYSKYLKEKISAEMYDDETGAFYDKLFDGSLTKVLTPTSFLPLFATACTKEQAKKMVKLLTDKTELWTEVPLATISQKHPTFSTDMWRGGVWLNLNYFVIKGLKNYGYEELAEELKTKTLECVNKWYKKTGAIFEFYDPKNELVPYYCDRKLVARKVPDWRKQVHSIIDYNWSACFTLMFIQDELY